jgi:hypothetical protein
MLVTRQSAFAEQRARETVRTALATAQAIIGEALPIARTIGEAATILELLATIAEAQDTLILTDGAVFRLTQKIPS